MIAQNMMVQRFLRPHDEIQKAVFLCYTPLSTADTIPAFVVYHSHSDIRLNSLHFFSCVISRVLHFPVHLFMFRICLHFGVVGVRMHCLHIQAS